MGLFSCRKEICLSIQFLYLVCIVYCRHICVGKVTCAVDRVGLCIWACAVSFGLPLGLKLLHCQCRCGQCLL